MSKSRSARTISVRPDEREDPYCRYKMDEVDIQVGRNKNAFMNISTICKQLEREPELLAKFLQRRMNSGLKYKEGLLMGPQSMTKEMVSSIIDLFISDNILCGKCGNPETELSDKGAVFGRTCRACGGEDEIPKG